MNKYLKLLGLIITFGLFFSIISVFYPKPFAFGELSNGSKLLLTKFSIFEPKYNYFNSGTSGSDRLEIIDLTLKRKFVLFWEVNNELTKNENKFIMKQDLEKITTSKELVNNSAIFADKFPYNESDSFKVRELKGMYQSPARDNSIHHNMDAFKKLKRRMVWNDYKSFISSGDFAFPPDDFHPIDSRIVYSIGSSKVSFAFLTFSDGWADLYNTSTLVDVGFVTQQQEKIIVPVNPDGTYNWEAIKDKID
jgi:hypothetical protein